MNARRGELCLLGLLALLWGSSYLFIKIAVAEIPPLSLIAARVAIAAALLLGLIAWQGRKLPRDRPTLGRLLLQAVFNSIAAWTLLAWGQQFTSSGIASVLNSTAPVFVVLAALLITRHEPVGPGRAAGAALGLAGVVLIVGAEALTEDGSTLIGQLAVLAGAMCYACAAIHGRRFAHLPAQVTAAGTMVWASIWLVPASLLIDRPWTLAPSAEALLSVLVLGSASTGLALILYFRLVRTLGPMGVASQSYLRAGVGMLLGASVLGEPVTRTGLLGLACIAAGVALINRPQAQPTGA